MSVDENIEFATMPLSTGPRLLYAERGDPTGEAIVSRHDPLPLSELDR
jgi:hypothetical protein